MMTHGVHGLEDAVLTVLAYVFPAFSFPFFLLYLRAPFLGKIGSWAILLGAFLSFMFVYRYSCHESQLCLNASMLAFARCTVELAWHLRFMFAAALCLQLAPERDPVRELLARLDA
jgi:amino acid transporter